MIELNFQKGNHITMLNYVTSYEPHDALVFNSACKRINMMLCLYCRPYDIILTFASFTKMRNMETLTKDVLGGTTP